MVGKNKQRCEAITNAGKPCKNIALEGTKYCSIHASKTVEDIEDKVATLKHQYDGLFSNSTQFAVTLKEQLQQIISSNSLALGVPMEQRVKDWESIRGKLDRKRLTLENIQELDDLIGLRIILLFKRDLNKIHELLSRTFNILSYEDTSTRLQEEQFGYQSVHYILSFPEAWLKVPTMKAFNGYKAEIQVRTLSQHIWAAASHKLQYKQEKNVPGPLRRSIHRISAVLEIVDLELERLLIERDKYVGELKVDQQDNKLNVDNVLQVLKSKWPIENMSSEEDLSVLLEELSQCGISTSSDLINLIDETYDKVMKLEKEILRSSEQDLAEYGDVHGTTAERVRRGVFFNFMGLTRSAIEMKYPELEIRKLATIKKQARMRGSENSN